MQALGKTKRRHPSGAQKRKARAAKLKEEAQKRAHEWSARYAELGPPPSDGARRVEWGNRIAALITYESSVEPALRTPQERRLILEGVRTLGMTAMKALYEERLRRIETELFGSSDLVDGLEDLDLPDGKH